MEMITLNGEPRTEVGTRVSRALRTTGNLPAIIYGHGEAPETLSLGLHDVEVALAHGARMLQVKLGSGTNLYLIKEVQYDYLDHTPIHLDLTRVDLDERVKVRVGIELRGVPKGISEGGVLDQHQADVEVECLVTEIPDTFRPVVIELALGDSLLVKDLEMPSGVVLLTDSEERIATVRALLEAPEPEEGEEGEEGAPEPKMIGRTSKEEDADKDESK